MFLHSSSQCCHLKWDLPHPTPTHSNPTHLQTFDCHFYFRFPTFTGVTFDGPSLFIAGENSKFMRKEHEPEIRR